MNNNNASEQEKPLFDGPGLTLCIDFNSFATYVGLAGCKELIQRHEVSYRWLPLITEARADAVPRVSGQADDPLEQYKARRARARRNYALHELQRNCDLLDISTMTAAERIFDTNMAAMGLSWANQQDIHPGLVLAYIESVFGTFYRDQHDLAVVSDINQLLLECGVSTDGFEVFTETFDMEGLQSKLLQAGIFESPAYLYEGELFQGRQHLPLLHWLLNGRQGLPPV